MMFLRRAVLLLSPLVVATSATGPGSLPPWWLLHKVKPEGTPKKHNGWTEVTFSKEQQATFGVGEDGKVTDEEKFQAAVQALDSESAEIKGRPSRRLMLPPWWLLHKVKPEGDPKDMGTWTAVTFSKEQQVKFAVDEDGEVVDQGKFDLAVQAFDAERAATKGQPSGRRLVEKPWWLLHGVKPAGKLRDMGGWTSITFSEEQQERFAVNEDGEIMDEDQHAEVIEALQGEGDSEKEDLMPPPPTSAPERKLYV